MGSGERGMEISLGAACCHWNRTCTEHNWWQCCFESGSTSCSTTTETELETELHSVLGKLDAMRSTLISQQNELNLILSRRRLFESSTRCPENSSVWEQPWHGRFIALQCLWYCFFYQLHVGIPQRMSLCRNVGFYFFWREIAWFISWLAYVSVSERNIVEQVNLIAFFCVDTTHVRIGARLCYAAKSGCEHVCSRSFCSLRLIQILGATAFCG